MFFFKKNHEHCRTLQIEDTIPLAVLKTLAPKHQKFLEKLFSSPSPHLEKFISKISTNHVKINKQLLEKMLEQLFIENNVPFQSLTLDFSKGFSTAHLDHQDPDKFNFWIKIIHELNIWKNVTSDFQAIYRILKVTDKMISAGINPRKQNLSTQKLSLAEESAFNFIYDCFKFFHAENIVEAAKPLHLYDLYCLLEEAAISKNLIRTSAVNAEFLRALHSSALIFSAIKMFPAAFADYIAYILDNRAEQFSANLALVTNEEYDPFFGRHQYVHKFNIVGFYIALSTWIKLLYPHEKDPQELKTWLADALRSQQLQKISVEKLQNISKRLIFIFNRLTISGYLLRSPVLKGLGYHPLIHTELPIKFLENMSLFTAYYANLSDVEQDELLENISQAENQSQALKPIR